MGMKFGEDQRSRICDEFVALEARLTEADRQMVLLVDELLIVQGRLYEIIRYMLLGKASSSPGDVLMICAGWLNGVSDTIRDLILKEKGKHEED